MQVTLPDGTPLELPDGATGADAAAAIGPGLAKAALAVKQGGEVRDLARPLLADAPLEVITAAVTAATPWTSSATTPRTSWPPRCSSSSRA